MLSAAKMASACSALATVSTSGLVASWAACVGVGSGGALRASRSVWGVSRVGVGGIDATGTLTEGSGATVVATIVAAGRVGFGVGGLIDVVSGAGGNVVGGGGASVVDTGGAVVEGSVVVDGS